MGSEDIADRLETIAEELDDLVIDQLRMATSRVAEGDEPDPDVLKEERRIASARRAVAKAAAILETIQRTRESTGRTGVTRLRQDQRHGRSMHR